jgi:signal transduction histidine kinase
VAIAFGSVVAASVLVAHTLFFFGSLLPLALLLYSAARWLDAGAYAVLLGPVLLLATYGIHVPPFGGSDYLFGAVLFGLSWGAGRLVRRLEKQRAELADALAGALREREARERALLLDERAHIARELHDVVASAVSVMVVQTGAARFALERSTDEAAARMLAVEDAGRSALSDLRRLLGLLRTGEDDDAGGPPPGLERLDELVAFLRRAGITVEVQRRCAPAELPTALDITAHRVVQEALTNVLKHSAAGSAVVRITGAGDRLVLEVVDDGPARAEAAAPSTGHGLIGMRERVALFDGRLEVGPSGRGWRVHAELPLSRRADVEAVR